MTINVFLIDRKIAEVNELYCIEPEQEYSGLFVDRKTPITARAGKEGLGFELIHPPDGIAGKKYFKIGDTLALADDLELEAA